MKIKIRKSEDRLKTQIDWLSSYHTFSFGEHYDPNWMGFKNLRVINDDYIEPNQGFPFHPHRNMEIVTFMLEGKLLHQDSLGNKTSILPGELQVMSAGSGIIHSEFSQSETGKVHLLQIWISPKEHNIKPRYDQKQILNSNNPHFIKLIAGINSSQSDILYLNANAQIWQGMTSPQTQVNFTPTHFKNAWIHLISGKINIDQYELNSGDAIGIEQIIDSVMINNSGAGPSHFLIFELDD